MTWLVRPWVLALSVYLALCAPRAVAAQDAVPSPRDVIGFEPGTDSLLADWSQIEAYLERLAAASPVVRLDTIGHTTLGRRLLLVTFATGERLARLDAIREGQALLADPRRMSAAVEDSLVGVQPAVVLINNNIHSTEIASSQMQLTLAHRFATHARYRAYLDSVIVLMIPSANPDGLDTVVRWYREHRGTAYEAGPLPWLYHPYVGHDNNRDWFMLTQVETQAISRVLYRDWFPEVVWDVHQMGSRGARLFVPPFADPVNPNIDPILVGAINLVGSAMAAAVLEGGKTGVVQGERYTLWWHGGFRTVPSRHNMVGILSEAASARLASPIEIHADSLRTPDPGVAYAAPWSGGVWTMGDIVEYELLAAEGLLQLVAAQRASFVRRFATLGRRAIAAGEAGEPAAFLIPPEQRDREATALLANVLIATGVELRRARVPFEADAMMYRAGTLVIPLAQPFRAHVKDLLEHQAYPARRQYAGGPLVPPYDVTGWTLGAQMGVQVIEVRGPVSVITDPVDTVAVEPGLVHGSGTAMALLNRANSESRAIVAALELGEAVVVSERPLIAGGDTLPAGSVVIPNPTDRLRAALAHHAAQHGFQLWAAEGLQPESPAIRRLPRIGLYRPWTASMDEGWTRWVLEQYGIPYQSVENGAIRAGRLDRRVDVLVIPDLSADQIITGRSEEDLPPQYAGGIDTVGVRHITEFVRRGGTLVTLGASSDFAIEALNLPVRNILREERDGAEGSRFLAPGSIFGVAVRPGSPLASGVPRSVAVFVDGGPAFVPADPDWAVARFEPEPLRSGYARAASRVAGLGALVEVPAGSGRVILFAFRPQHRAQTLGSMKLLFNALLLRAAR